MTSQMLKPKGHSLIWPNMVVQGLESFHIKRLELNRVPFWQWMVYIFGTNDSMMLVCKIA